MKLFQIPILGWLLFAITGCKEEYYPQVKSSEQSVLVVDGVLNSGEGATIIKLTRTFKLDDTAKLRPELGAQVNVESKSGGLFPLNDMQRNGSYAISQLPLVAGESYRLRIKTFDGKEYLSEFLTIRNNPAIDSVNWVRTNQGVQVFVNTHNPENDTRYYRWEYDETWELRSSYYSTWKMENGLPVQRAPDDQVYLCWRTNYSSAILLGSSAQLASDVISKKLLLEIPAPSEKLGERYSVMVRQYALDKKAYAFYQLLKKNTETLGSIFDAQPSEIIGNLHSVSDSTERVIGFITATPVQEKRIFISRFEVPGWGFWVDCDKQITVANNVDSIRKYFTSDYLPYSAKMLGPIIQEYYGARPPCTDCTLRGGSPQKPGFW